MSNPKVYVGTYKKYNEGSIAGGWVSLAECENYGQFLTKCKELHKDERDPEYMIQDTEDFPDGLACMEWLNEGDFNDVKEAMSDKPNVSIVDYSEKSFIVTGDTYPIKNDLKRLGGVWFRKGQGWLFPIKKREAVESFISGASAAEPVKVDKSNKFIDWLDEFIGNECKTDSDKKYYGKENVGAIKIGSHYYLIKKPSIKNRFCFHDEGSGYDFYESLCADESKMRQYFINRNEREFTDTIDRIEKGEQLRIKEGDYMNRFCIYVGCRYYDREDGRQATDEERKLILEGLQFGLEKFRTRLNAYLKRYGISKLHTWTYWADA